MIWLWCCWLWRVGRLGASLAQCGHGSCHVEDGCSGGPMMSLSDRQGGGLSAQHREPCLRVLPSDIEKDMRTHTFGPGCWSQPCGTDLGPTLGTWHSASPPLFLFWEMPSAGNFLYFFATGKLYFSSNFCEKMRMESPDSCKWALGSQP